MISPSQIWKGITNPALIGRKINRLYYTQLGKHPYNPNGVNVIEEDWDNLIILDACRYDMFSKLNSISGRLESRYSRGSSTTEFLRGNFGGQSLHDTVYVTANPQLYRFQQDIAADFFKVINVWMEEGWDEKTGTVLPQTTTKYAMGAADKHPNKRLIVHYIQPHYPFIHFETDFDKGQLEDPEKEASFWEEILKGNLEVPLDLIWEAYSENLRKTLPEVSRLIESISGKTVVTSDHGNMVGERAFPIPIREWGHPLEVYTDQLVHVPWLVIENESRKEIIAEKPLREEQNVDQGIVKDRLKDLGYV